MITIKNDILETSFSPKGAELRSLRLIDNGLEFIWQANPLFWAKSSPLLFPIVGSLRNGSYLHKGKEYNLPRHGFARDREFKVAEQSESKVRFLLESDDHTKAVYPFDWLLSVEYSLCRETLTTTWTVENKGSVALPFSIGAHPAFRVPLIPGQNYEDTLLEFERSEKLVRGFLDADGLVTKERQELPMEGKSLHLSHSLFDNDALLFDSIASRRVTLRSEKSPWSLSIEFPGFEYFGIWSAKGADFVCLEPWKGIADDVSDDANTGGEITRKKGIQILEPGEVSRSVYSIIILKD